MSLALTITDLTETEELARLLAEVMTRAPFSILMYGDLGSGKTTFTRALTAHLPGGDTAEVSSPSFTVCNVYPTEPPVLHCDLYRCGSGASLPEEAEEALEDGAVLVAEWSEYLRETEKPADRLEISFDFLPESKHTARALTLDAYGPNAGQALSEIGRRSAESLIPPQPQSGRP